MDLDGFLGLARGLIAIPSTAERPAELARALDYVLDVVGGGFTVERFESNGKPSALVYRATGDGRPHFDVILNAHLDVVPAGDELFTARLDGGRLYGRGTQDMKVTALAQALAFREVAAGTDRPVALQLVTDEEVGGVDGTRHQVAEGVRGRFVVIGEHSGLAVVTESKGLIRAYLRATGRGAHSAYPWFGDNALVRLVRTAERLLARYPVATEEVWRTTVNLARIETPNTAFNQIPAAATAWLDLRFPPEDPDLAGRSRAELADFLAGFCEPGVTVEIDAADPPHRADPDRPEIAWLVAAARAEGYPSGFLRKHGAGDGRFYAAAGIDAVAFGVGGDGQHGPTEYADVTTIQPYRRALASFLRQAVAS
jgi:succinyl-diaminopimelate desuccinylase